MTDRAPEEGWLRTTGTTTASFNIDVSEHESGIYALLIRSGNVNDGTAWTANICPVAANELRSLADIILSALPDDRAGLTVAPCTDCGEPSEPATICPSCSTARCVDLGRTEWAKHTARCTDCREPPGLVVVCEACATARCESVAAAQRQRDAEICRQIHSTSRQRVELALLCAGAIEGASDDQ